MPSHLCGIPLQAPQHQRQCGIRDFAAANIKGRQALHGGAANLRIIKRDEGSILADRQPVLGQGLDVAEKPIGDTGSSKHARRQT